MSEALARFNSLPRDEAEQHLLACCGSRAWASTVATGRPYVSVPALLIEADQVWTGLAPADWLEAFTAHPRLGESGGRSPDRSEKEQSRIMDAGDETLPELAEANRRYEARFGHIFLISAAGLTAAAVLAALHERISNDPAVELEVAAEEQRKIMRLRLESMLQR